MGARGVNPQALAGRGGMPQPRPPVAQPRPPAYKITATVRNQPAQGNVMSQPAVPQADQGMSVQVRDFDVEFYNFKDLRWCKERFRDHP